MKLFISASYIASLLAQKAVEERKKPDKRQKPEPKVYLVQEKVKKDQIGGVVSQYIEKS